MTNARSQASLLERPRVGHLPTVEDLGWDDGTDLTDLTDWTALVDPAARGHQGAAPVGPVAPGFCRTTVRPAGVGHRSTARPSTIRPSVGSPLPGSPEDRAACRQRGTTAPSRSVGTSTIRRRRLVLAAFVVAILVALALPISALGGRTVHGAAGVAVESGRPTVYVVQSGDTLASVAARVDPKAPAAVAQAKVAAQLGSRTVVTGEHVRLD